jgi:hypothetical protein
LRRLRVLALAQEHRALERRGASGIGPLQRLEQGTQLFGSSFGEVVLDDVVKRHLPTRIQLERPPQGSNAVDRCRAVPKRLAFGVQDFRLVRVLAVGFPKERDRFDLASELQKVEPANERALRRSEPGSERLRNYGVRLGGARVRPPHGEDL